MANLQDIGFYAAIQLENVINEDSEAWLFALPRFEHFQHFGIKGLIDEITSHAVAKLIGPEAHWNRPAIRPLVMGIAPGLHGAIAALSATPLIEDMNLFVTEDGHNCTDVDALDRLIGQTSPGHVFIEQPQTSPSANFEVVTSILTAIGTRFTEVSGTRWRDTLQVKDGDVRARASCLIPKHADQWRLEEHGNRAQAALIAFFGFQALSDPKGAKDE